MQHNKTGHVKFASVSSVESLHTARLSPSFSNSVTFGVATLHCRNPSQGCAPRDSLSILKTFLGKALGEKQLYFELFAEWGDQTQIQSFQETFVRHFFFSLILDIFKESGGGGEAKSKPYEDFFFQLKFKHFLRKRRGLTQIKTC